MALRINNEYVADEVFLEEFRLIGGLDINPEHPTAQQEARILSQLAEQRVIDRVLLLQMAVAAGVKITDAEVDDRRNQQWGTSSASVSGTGIRQVIRNNLLIEKYCNWVTRHEPRPSRNEVHIYYLSHKEQFFIPEQAEVMQIIRNLRFKEDEPSAIKIIEQAERELANGVSFTKVADRYSDCGGKIKLGWVKRDEMVPEFEEIVFSTPPGQWSKPFRTVFGYHIVNVLKRKSAGYQEFDEIRSMLAQRILQERKNKKIDRVVAEAMRQAQIVPVSVDAKGGAS